MHAAARRRGRAAPRGSTRSRSATGCAACDRAPLARLRDSARTIFGAEPSELSLLFFRWYVQAAGGFQALTEFDGAAQDARVAGGVQQVCELVADQLGDSMALSSPVSAITQSPNGIVSVRAGEREIRGRHAVCALASPLLRAVAFDPPLPSPREALTRRTTMGAYMKAVAVYDRAWWRDRGLSGVAFADRGPVQMVVDDSPPGGRPGILVGFITGRAARDLRRVGTDERRDVIVAAMAQTLANDAPQASEYRDLNWLDERWSLGAPVSLMVPGVLTELGEAVRPPVGLVHWAGTDTATEWNGYVEGGIQAGERVARKIVAALGERT